MAIIDNSAAHCSHNHHTRVNICSNVHQSFKRLSQFALLISAIGGWFRFQLVLSASTVAHFAAV